MIFAALAVGMLFAADAADVTGEWIVGEDDVSGSGITVSIAADQPGQQHPAQAWLYGGSLPPRSADILRKTISYDFTVIPVGALFDFETNGSKLTGALIRYGTEEPIFDGKINGNKISFTVKETVKGKNYSYLYRGELSDNGIRFEVTPTNGGKQFQFRAKRVVTQP